MWPFSGAREIKRLREIVRVLNKYGFDIVLKRLRLYYHLPFRKKVNKGVETLTTPQRARKILEELGPIFIKFGQILSTRSDLIPKEYIYELRKLQDKIPSFPFEEVKVIVERELNSPMESIFESFDREPLASASLAQVHRATLKDGRNVVVKVQRAGIEPIIESDLTLLSHLASLAEKRIPELRNYNPAGIVRQLKISIRKELDFVREGRNTERFTKNFRDVDYIVIPQVFWEHTTKKILILEYLEGIKIDELEKLTAMGYNRKLLAERGAEAIMMQIFVFGFFQGDPHPGNILVLRDNKLGLIDFGQVGRLRKSLKEKLVDFAIAIIKKDTEGIYEVLLRIGAMEHDVPSDELRDEIEDIVSDYYDVKLSHVNIASLVQELFDISLTYRVRMPPDFAILIKSLVTSEAIARQLYSEFNITEVAEPFVKNLIKERLSVGESSKRVARKSKKIGNAIFNIPLKTEAFLDKINTTGLNLKHVGFEELIEELDTLSNRISFALIISAIIIGSSIVMTTGEGLKSFDLPMVGLISFLFASLLGSILLFRIIKSRRL
ncbi:putative protein kinase UbiB [archaeon]|nr:putative protein kinase UbiB [archaeon]